MEGDTSKSTESTVETQQDVAHGNTDEIEKIEPSAGKNDAAEPSAESQAEPSGLKAFVVGGTGGVGKELVKQLAFTNNFEKITLVVRRDVTFDEYITNRTEQKVIDFDKIEEYKDVFHGYDVGYCCLGSQRSKGGVEAFKKVDHDYIVNTAKIAAEDGCKEFHLCSSMGANEKSRMLYMNVKGQVEREISEMPFSKVFLYRPGLLLCDNRPERRIAESFFRVLMKPITFFFPTAGSVPVEYVAKAMVKVTLSQPNPEQKVNILENKDIHKLAASK